MNDLVQSTPYMPPIPSKMPSSCQIFLFGDLTISFEEDLGQLLHIKDNPPLISFFERAAYALRAEIAKLPVHEQLWFPRFTTIVDLVYKMKETQGTPALSFALLSLYEVGQFIKYFGEGSKTFPSAANSYLVGLCTGSYAAAAISTSQSISELIPAGTEAFLVAFRTGLRALEFRNDIQKPIPGSSQSWSAIVSAQESQAVQAIESFSSSKGLPQSSKPYVSAVTPTCVTISGPPSILQEVLTANSYKPHALPIEAPYHAPHLYGEHDVDEIVGEFHDDALRSYKPRMPVLSAATGKVIAADDFKSMLHSVVSDTLLMPVRLDKVLDSCAQEFFGNSSFKDCAICPVASNLGQHISSALGRTSELEVTISDALNGRISASQPAVPTGKFSQSKIAIVGYSGRFPDSATPEEFWDLLHNGRDVHREIPKDRFDWEAHFDPTGKKKNTSMVKYGCFIKEPGLFDTRFFNMSPREAESTDPAQRLLITSTYEALEMAGMVSNRTPSTQEDRVGCFFGVTSDDWREVNSGQNVDTYFIPGGNRAFVPGRISYFFRFSGPSISIDTACSSSFAAIQTACSYLWRGDCDTAIAGGTNVLTNPDNFAGLDRGHFLSRTGNCNAFDDGASGYCRADAVGSVILKRLEDAIADKDPIFSVVSGAYTNHCGQTESITRPHEGDQAFIFNKILRHANQDPLDISYVEMHGTGTQAGDATEMNSVLSTFVPGRQRMPRHPLHLGSAKANIGHAESASGVSSLIKVMMMMKHNEIPPHCGIKTKINHNYPLDLNDRNVHIALEPTAWNRKDQPCGTRKVFLNNFSAAGGNTAVLLEDAPVPASEIEQEDPRSTHLIAFSAKSAKALQGNVETMIDFLEKNQNISLPQVAYTTTARRMHHNYRAIVSGSDVESVRNAMQRKLENIDTKPVPNAAKIPKVAFVFTGQGSLYTGVGKQLFETLSQFRADILRFDAIAQKQGFPSFLPLIDGTTENSDDAETVVGHLALTCVQMALTRLWISWGVLPSSTTGHSLGEYAALHAAGVLTASDAIYLVGKRGLLLAEHCSQGTHAMLAIKAPLDAVKPQIEGSTCEVACINQPSGTVISGPNEEISRLTDEYKAPGQDCVKLDIPFAFHSAQVEPILDVFEQAASGVTFNAPQIPYLSPLTGEVVTEGNTLGASYLARACRNEVNFLGALEAAKESATIDERTIWIEIGSHPACSGMIKGSLGTQSVTIASLRKNTDTWKLLATGLESLYLNGLNLKWSEYHRDFKAAQKVIELPRYAWDMKNYWIMYKNNFCLTKGDDPAPAQIEAAPTEQKASLPYVSPSVQRVLEENHDEGVSTILVESDINDPRLAPVIQGHKVNTVALCPSSLYADIAMTIANRLIKAKSMDVETTGLDAGDMKVDRPLISVPNSGEKLLRVSASADWSSNVVTLAFYSVNAQGKKTADHAKCNVTITPKQNWSKEWNRNAYLINSRVKALEAGVDEGESHKMKRGIVYKLFSSLVDYAPQYQGMQEVVLNSEDLEATARVKFQVGDEGYCFNPCWVDSLGHLAGFIMNGNDNVYSKDQVFVNHGWDAMRCTTKFVQGKTYQTYNRMQLIDGTLYGGDTYILDEGKIVAIFEGVKFQGVNRSVLDQLLPGKPGAAKGAAKPANTQAPAARTPAQAKSEPKPATSPKAAPKQKAAPKAAKPSNDVGPRVMAIISEEAGVDADELKQNNDFADYGIDSLLSLNISGRLQEELNLTLPSTVFSDHPTPNDLIAFIGGNNDTAGSQSATSEDDDSSSQADDSDSDVSSEGYETGATSGVSTPVPEKEDTMAIIRATIAEETGVDSKELTPTTSFAECGVDSLLALNIMGQLSEIVEMELPQTLLSDNDTLGDVQKALGLNSTKGPSATKPDAAATAAAQEVAKPEAKKPETSSPESDALPHASSVLLQGSPKTASKILFLFPDGSGSATSYAPIPKISQDVAVYGLSCPWMKNPWDMKCNFEELSTKYIAEIRRRQPKGPYYFGGWSAGGISAYEAAQQLARVGEETERLILIDSPNPVGLENPPQRMYDFFESLDFFGMNGKTPPNWLRPHFDAFIQTLDDYEVKPFAGSPLKTHMVYARDGICKNPDDPRPEIRDDDPREMLWLLNNRTDFSGSGWQALVGKENMTIDVLDDVNHFSMVAPGPKIKELGSFIGNAMK